MTDGPRLLHPEWVLFYRQGITPEKIAELNDQPVQKVRDYLGRIAHKYPEMVEGRLYLHDRPRPRPESVPDRDRRWKAAHARVLAFIEEHGRRPYRNSYDDPEGPLAQWLSTQRSEHNLGRLAVHRARWLNETIPGWQTDTRSLHYDAAWRLHLVDVVRLRTEHGRWPRRGGSEEPLGTWLDNQRTRHHAGVLPAERRRALDRDLPGWRGPS
ncbi:helicase associated domain-containing protein [Citricoccus sp.]|uniref:helicase associated domain-containing protein n=1 Tax=Citricoccus sp. TaxID=1978372 RepID=UPI0028BD907D|nr:helicase associated domain-containing protein [Citricoccus sp.]